jgi:acyl-CoA thioesterase
MDTEREQQLEQICQSAHASGYFRLLDMHIENALDGVGAASIQVDARLMHAQNIVHGGLIFTLADTAMSMALLSTLTPQTLFSTIEAKINYFLPVRTGALMAEATIVHRARTIAVLEAVVYNTNADQRVMIAKTLGTFNIQTPRTA